jgi:hypothetical protein
MAEPFYRTTDMVKWGAGKGANLTPTEVDTSFWNLRERIRTLEESPPAANNIDEITVSGSQMTITMEDASTFGPFTLPTSRWRWRGEFADATVYAVEDFFSDPDTGSIYRVLIGHTSATPFDPDLESGGDPVYELILDVSDVASGSSSYLATVEDGPNPADYIDPVLADAGKVWLTMDSTSNFTSIRIPTNATVAFPIGTTLSVFEWWRRGFIDGVVGVDVYGKNLGDQGTSGFGTVLTALKVATNTWVLIGDEGTNRYINNTSGTITLDDWHRGAMFCCTNASATTVTIPNSTTEPFFQTGDKMEFIQDSGGGTISFSLGVGVTLMAKSGAAKTSNGVGSIMAVEYRGSNIWYLSGDYI